MTEIKNFHEALEGDLKRLTAEISDQRGLPGAEQLPEKEIVRRSLENFSVASPAAVPAVPAVKSDDRDSILPKYFDGKNVDPKVKIEVERLVELVFTESLEKAVSEVRKHPAFVQDSFHDALIDKLLPELKARGIIK